MGVCLNIAAGTGIIASEEVPNEVGASHLARREAWASAEYSIAGITKDQKIPSTSRLVEGSSNKMKVNNEKETLAKRLKEAREYLGLSQELCRQTGRDYV